MIAESRDKALMDIESLVSDALEEGRQEGRQEGVYSVAKNLLQEKMPAEAVVRVTDLSLEEVKRLAAELLQ
jgi:predicted transposase/invertase (TIGR01784 family)